MLLATLDSKSRQLFLEDDFQKDLQKRLQSQLERAERLLNQATMDVRYWGNQIAVVHQSLARFGPR